jgi:N-acetylated-alpha-linked acidic dipeptidase
MESEARPMQPHDPLDDCQPQAGAQRAGARRIAALERSHETGEFLRRDAVIYALLTYRLCSSAILPLDYSAVVDELKAVVGDLQAKAGDSFDLCPVAEKLAALGSAVEKLQGRIMGLKKGHLSDGAAWVVNRCLMELGRTLIPVNYTRTGQFDQDLAVPTQPLPGLQGVAKLAPMEKASDERQFLITRLVRERNRVVHGVLSATRAIDAALAALERGS